MKKILLTIFTVSAFCGLMIAPFGLKAAQDEAYIKHYSKYAEAYVGGAAEVPPINTGMSGHGSFTISDDERSIFYELYVYGGNGITQAHLHCGAPGENGPIVVPLFMSNSNAGIGVNGRLSRGTITQADITAAGMSCTPNIETVAHLAQAIREGKIYVNVHTVTNPNGEIRGQLMNHYTLVKQDGTTYVPPTNSTTTPGIPNTGGTTANDNAILQQLENALNTLKVVLTQLGDAIRR